MYLPFYHFETERTLFSDNTFGMIGRALTFAVYFESTFKRISELMSIKSTFRSCKFGLENDNEFKCFLERLESKSLYQHIKKIGLYFEFDEDITSLMIKAKNARNFIAHELTLGIGINDIIETDKSREYVSESLREKITEIAKANIILTFLICLATNEDLPSLDYLKKYINMILKWVLEVDD